jgi:hypothetical protein
VSTSASAELAADFTLYPSYYSAQESRTLLAGALWKLDRADFTRRRRRSALSAPKEEKGQAGGDDSLQDMFTGEYGFEEVSWSACLS